MGFLPARVPTCLHTCRQLALLPFWTSSPFQSSYSKNPGVDVHVKEHQPPAAPQGPCAWRRSSIHTQAARSLGWVLRQGSMQNRYSCIRHGVRVQSVLSSGMHYHVAFTNPPGPLASGKHCSTPASITQGSSHHALHLYGPSHHALHTFPPLGALHHGLHVGLGVLHVGDLQPELVHHHLGERKKGKWHSTAQRRNSARATPGPGHRCLLPRCRGTVPIAGKAQQGALGTAVALQLQHCTDPSPGAASCPPGGPRG